jgi:thioredoxin 1
MTARHVNSEAFEREVLNSELPTLVDFYADWCGPCRVMGPVVDELANDLQGRANVVKVNVDESPELAARYGVQSIPTFLVVSGGKPTQRFIGVQGREALASAVAA